MKTNKDKDEKVFNVFFIISAIIGSVVGICFVVLLILAIAWAAKQV